MKAYFSINFKLYSTNEIKIMTILNKMNKGQGINFSKMWYNKMSNATINTKEKFFDKFAQNFETIFYPFDIKATAHTNLTKLIQKTFWEENGTFNNGFQKFITNFQNLTAKAGISDEPPLWKNHAYPYQAIQWNKLLKPLPSLIAEPLETSLTPVSSVISTSPWKNSPSDHYQQCW